MCVSDTVYFKHKYITTSTVMKADDMIKAAKELTKAITSHLPIKVPALNYEVLKMVAQIYDEVTTMKVPEVTLGSSS